MMVVTFVPGNFLDPKLNPADIIALREAVMRYPEAGNRDSTVQHGYDPERETADRRVGVPYQWRHSVTKSLKNVDLEQMLPVF